MIEIQYNENVRLGYQHIPIYASANAILGTKYRTKIWVLSGNAKYPIGEEDGKLDEETIKARFTEAIGTERERQYGQQTTLLRKELRPHRNRGKVGTLGQQLDHSTMRGRDILDRD